MFTGKLNNLSRAEAKSIVEKNSGSIVSSVNKKLNLIKTYNQAYLPDENVSLQQAIYKTRLSSDR